MNLSVTNLWDQSPLTGMSILFDTLLILTSLWMLLRKWHLIHVKKRCGKIRKKEIKRKKNFHSLQNQELAFDQEHVSITAASLDLPELCHASDTSFKITFSQLLTRTDWKPPIMPRVLLKTNKTKITRKRATIAKKKAQNQKCNKDLDHPEMQAENKSAKSYWCFNKDCCFILEHNLPCNSNNKNAFWAAYIQFYSK